MKVALFGYGQMGKAIKYGFEKLGHEVQTYDNRIEDIGQDYYIDLAEDEREVNHELRFILNDQNNPVDCVVSSLPYFLNLVLAKKCIDYKIPYFDLGGHVETSKLINEHATTHRSLVFTDLGLAPGWVNIIAHNMANQHKDIHSIDMYCGGLPDKPYIDDPLKYKLTWSLDGLLNEYRDDCKCLVDGKEVYLKGLSERHFTQVGSHYLEAAMTSGGSGHCINTLPLHVKNCRYFTLRYEGHFDVMSVLLQSIPNDKICKVINHFGKDYENDFVVIKVHGVSDTKGYTENVLIHSDSRFSAMQKCTAFPLVSVVDSILGYYKFVWPSYRGSFSYDSPVDYSHVCLDHFNTTLEHLLNDSTNLVGQA